MLFHMVRLHSVSHKLCRFHWLGSCYAEPKIGSEPWTLHSLNSLVYGSCSSLIFMTVFESTMSKRQ